MTPSFRTLFALLILGTAAAATPESTLAYGGPGSVISGIGALLAAVAALLASLLGFIWFPLKRLYQRMTEEGAKPADPAADASENTAPDG